MGPDAGRPTILLVEDERSIAEPFAAALQREGFEAVIAPTARAAQEQFERRTPALVLLDVGLPDGDGRELCRTSGAPRRSRSSCSRRAARRPTASSAWRSAPTTTSSSPSARARSSRGSAPSCAGPVAAKTRRRSRRRDRRPARRPGGAARDPRRRGDHALAQGVRPARAARPRRGPRRDARGPDGRRVGRELVRLHQDARRAHRVPAAQARRRPRRPALRRDRARGRLPVQGPRGRRDAASAAADRVRLRRRTRRRGLRGTAGREPQRPGGRRGPHVRAHPGRRAGGGGRPAHRDARRRPPRRAGRQRRARGARAGGGGRPARPGRVADSADRSLVGANYAGRPEIATALRGRRVQDERHSSTLGQDILATSSPVFGPGA